MDMMDIRGNCCFSEGTSNSSDNLSESIMGDLHDHELKFSVVFFILLVLSGLTVFTNALILAAFYVENKLRTYPNWYILNITIADLIVGLVCMPLGATVHLYSDGWHFGKVTSILFIGFQNSILSVSVCGLIVICVDRYIATFYPIKHYQRKNIRKASIVNIFTWILSFGLWMMITCAWTLLDPIDSKIHGGFLAPNFTKTETASIIVFVLRFVLPFSLIAGFYLRIYFRVKSIFNERKKRKSIQQTHLDGKRKHAPEQEINNGSIIQRNDMDAFNGLSQCQCNRKDAMSAAKKKSVNVPSISLNLTKDSVAENNSFQSVELGSVETVSTSTSKSHVVGGNTSRSQLTLRNKASMRNKTKSTTESRKAMRTLSFIIVAFVVTWLPSTGVVTISSFSRELYHTISNGVNLREVTRWISYSNSLINPVAYAMAQPLIRDTVVKILCCRRHSRYVNESMASQAYQQGHYCCMPVYL